jgi:hypothetical protein
VLLLGGVCASPQSWGFAGVTGALTSLGFNVAELDLLRPRWDLCNSPIDDIVASLRAVLDTSAFGAAPLAFAYGPVDTALLRYYLESWPLAGVVALAPLPPDVGAWIAAHSTPGAPPDPLRCAKRACEGAPTYPPALAAGLAATGALRNRGATVVAARVLTRMAAAPLKLEPGAVPALVLGSPGHPLCSAEELRAAAAAHGVTPTVLGGGGARLPREPLAPGDAAGEAAAGALRGAVAEFLKRF